ncbi:hypothetical protein A6302_03098 [Methylobrevis pamukkalensis]|uniref:Uncharacterized protein n=2 Tax=Methylobrevis pamukkalensis TaxID=1439726 RepID=A0A1E3GZZ2_9HYPH|nr:hypothetical protein A6302_03098 [Methylobrevis pamukkalensis]
MGFPRTTREGRWLSIFAALMTASLVRIAGFGVAGIAANDIRAIAFVYAVPLTMIAGFGLAIFIGASPAIAPGIDGTLRDLLARLPFRRADSGHTGAP